MKSLFIFGRPLWPGAATGALSVGLLAGALSVPVTLAHAQGAATATAGASAATGASARGAAPVAIEIDGRAVAVDPAPLLEGGSVFVPLRGVLESLGARVAYDAPSRRITIDQGGRRFVLVPGQASALVDGTPTTIVAPRLEAGRAFVPLRAVAELFGYRVNWTAATRTVSIGAGAPSATQVATRQTLAQAGRYGVSLELSGLTPAQVGPLLDAAREAGFGLVKARFDWGDLEPERGAPYRFDLTDALMREATARGLVVVGVLGNTAPWASVSTTGSDIDRRQSPPREAEYASWRAYVTRVVGRYRGQVRAWQVWESPNSVNLRSVPRTYRRLANDAIAAARAADPGAVVHVAEPGGVNLRFVRELASEGVLAQSDGVNLYPATSWQPGTRAQPEELIRPSTVLRESAPTLTARPRDYWIGGFAVPVFISASSAAQEALETNPALRAQRELWTPEGQADFVIKTTALALANRHDKVFYGALNDAGAGVFTRDGQTFGTGLVAGDGTRRPAFAAMREFIETVGERPFAGTLAFGPELVALLFDDGQSGVVVAWSPSGGASLHLAENGATLAADEPEDRATSSDRVTITTRPDTRVHEAGESRVKTAGPLRLSRSPVLISNVGFETASQANRLGPHEGLVLNERTVPEGARAVSASFEAQDDDAGGLEWRRFAGFGGAANRLVSVGGRMALVTQAQRNIWDLTSARPFIYFDVADDFSFDDPGDFVLELDVWRLPDTGSSIVSGGGGFLVEYDAINGYAATPRRTVETGEGWSTMRFELPGARFANTAGYDIAINATGSKSDIAFGAARLRRAADAPALAADVPAQAAD